MSRDVNDPNHNNPLSAEIYVMNADGTGTPRQLTNNSEEERGPDWSPDGSRIVFACRKGPAGPGGAPTFEICVMNADGSGEVQLTSNNVPDLTPTWSPDGSQIVFHRTLSAGVSQFFVMNADGTATTQITGGAGQGVNVLADWGELRVKTDG